MNSLTLLYISRIFGGLFSSALYTAVTGFVGDLSTEENRNKYMGFMGMSIVLGFIFGPALGGLLGKISLSTPFTISSILIFLLFIYASIILTEPERHITSQTHAIVPKGTSMLFQPVSHTLLIRIFFHGDFFIGGLRIYTSIMPNG